MLKHLTPPKLHFFLKNYIFCIHQSLFSDQFFSTKRFVSEFRQIFKLGKHKSDEYTGIIINKRYRALLQTCYQLLCDNSRDGVSRKCLIFFILNANKNESCERRKKILKPSASFFSSSLVDGKVY